MPEMLARYEFKYLVPASIVAGIREVARLYCEPDAYGADGIYSVNSLYFDSWDWQLARQTLEGVRNRFKLRMRTYGWAEDDVVFCEIKGRVGTSIVKNRALIDRKYAHGIANGDPPPVGGFVTKKANHQKDLDQYRMLMERYDLRPRVWIRYRREAYGSAFGDGSRLTFDTELQAQMANDRHPYVPEPDAWRNLPLDGPPTILEMKFNGAFPQWMVRLTHAYDLTRLSVSKYVTGAVTCGSVPWASLERGMRWTAF